MGVAYERDTPVPVTGRLRSALAVEPAWLPGTYASRGNGGRVWSGGGGGGARSDDHKDDLNPRTSLHHLHWEFKRFLQMLH